MKLWKLKAKEWWGYDEYEGHVVRASDEQSARRLAANKDNRFNDADESTCVEIPLDGETEIILIEFHAG